MTTTFTRFRDTVVAPFETRLGLLPFAAPEIRIEAVIEDGRYVVRAEIPGVDPQKDVALTVSDGLLRITVQRAETQHDRAHSEFHYGRLERAVTLPSGAEEATATAHYAQGILEICFAMGEPKDSARRIPIDVAKEVNGKVRR